MMEVNIMAIFPLDSEDGPEKIRTFFGPDQVDRTIRQAIQFC